MAIRLDETVQNVKTSHMANWMRSFTDQALDSVDVDSFEDRLLFAMKEEAEKGGFQIPIMKACEKNKQMTDLEYRALIRRLKRTGFEIADTETMGMVAKW